MNNERVLPIEGAVNFRDLGGYQSSDGRCVKWRHLFRSGKLNGLSKGGQNVLRQLGIKTLVDLRYADEWVKHPTPMAAFEAVEVLTVPAEDHEPAPEDAHEEGIAARWKEILLHGDEKMIRGILMKKYPEFLDSHRAIFQQMLDRLVEGNAPLLFHCAAGKDRTGAAGALLLSLLGVPKETIREDYVLTQKELGDHLENWMVGGAVIGGHYQELLESLQDVPFERIKPLFDADVSYIDRLLEVVDEQYGSFDQYAMQRLGQTEARLERLREQLLE